METRSFQLAELRAVDDASPRTLRGVAIVYGQLGEFRTKTGVLVKERVNAGALAKTLANTHDIKARFEHRDLLASRSNGTLRLTDTPQGLAFEMDVAETRAGDDTLALVKRGDITGCSFGFLPAANGQRWGHDTQNRSVIRDLDSIDLFEITVTDRPVYTGTSIALRSVDQAVMDEAERMISMPDRRMKVRRLLAAV